MQGKLNNSFYSLTFSGFELNLLSIVSILIFNELIYLMNLNQVKRDSALIFI